MTPVTETQRREMLRRDHTLWTMSFVTLAASFALGLVVLT